MESTYKTARLPEKTKEQLKTDEDKKKNFSSYCFYSMLFSFIMLLLIGFDIQPFVPSIIDTTEQQLSNNNNDKATVEPLQITASEPLKTTLFKNEKAVYHWFSFFLLISIIIAILTLNKYKIRKSKYFQILIIYISFLLLLLICCFQFSWFFEKIEIFFLVEIILKCLCLLLPSVHFIIYLFKAFSNRQSLYETSVVPLKKVQESLEKEKALTDYLVETVSVGNI